MKDQEFTILVGSCARGTNDAHSDIDIVRVGHKRPLRKAQLRTLSRPESPISYIDYDNASFASLYETGSVFIHHILTEGKLIAGNPHIWADLVENFTVTKDLHSEIREQAGLCKWLARPEAFADATMPLLSHLFRALKNAAIFSLAQQGVYVYEKRAALRQAFHFLTDNDIELLLEANNAYERGASQSISSTIDAANSLPDLCARVGSAAGELLQNGNLRDSHAHPKRNRPSRAVQFR